MEDNTFKKACRRGFTLIELMIVIVILGVLMGTILPRLTGAQARARDTGRIADLNTISQALETYYDDFGKYPGTSGTAYCLDTAYSSTNAWLDDIATYLKGGNIPTPPTERQVTALIGSDAAAATDGSPPCGGSYLYIPLKNRGLANNGYALISDVEAYQNANVDLTATLPTGVDTDVSAYSGRITDLSAETTHARSSAYMIVN